MNIKERKHSLLQKLDARRFGHSSKKEEKDIIEQTRLEFDWNLMIKPPITSFIAPYGLQQLSQLAKDVKLMAKPVQRYKIMESIMGQFGFHVLASGTNRRVFYCAYDPSIIVKIGSDRVGMADNISEYHLQNILKPFCPKTYDVTPDGVAALSERVEPMTEKDFKITWASEIFDLTLSILNKGYIMEDIGGNFYKNWGVRIGFGPVILDYPYIYEVNWSNLKCTFIDPVTHVKCDGELDYDYSKGMSEIVCEKCGTRYSARHLAKNLPSNAINLINHRKGKFKLDNNVRISLRRGDKVVFRSYNEADVVPTTSKHHQHSKKNADIKQARFVATREGGGNNVDIRGSVDNPKIVQPVLDKANHTAKKNNATDNSPRIFRVDLGGSKQKENEGIIPARKTEEPVVSIVRPEDNNTPKTGSDLYSELAKFLLHVYDKNGIDAFIDTCDKMGLPCLKKYGEEYKSQLMAKSAKADSPKEETVNKKEDTPVIPKPIAKPEPKPEENELEKVHSVTTEDPNRQKNGLYPVKPKTSEEIEAEDTAARADNSIMGFPGEPLVDTMKIKEQIPLIKNDVINALNGFTKEGDDTMVISFLENKITELISPKIESLLSTGTKGLEVMVNAIVDHRNNSCYTAKVEALKSPLFEVTIYPEGQVSEDSTIAKSNVAPGINLLDDQNMQEEAYVPNSDLSEECEKIVAEFDIDEIMTNASSEEVGKNNIIRRLICELMDNAKGPYAKVVEEATRFVNTKLAKEQKPEKPKMDDVLMEDDTVANEL